MKKQLLFPLLSLVTLAVPGADLYRVELSAIRQNNVVSREENKETILKFYSAEKRSTLWSHPLSAETIARLENKIVYLTGLISYEDVTFKPKPWNGVKLMLGTTLEDGRQWNPGARIPTGSSDGWVRYQVKIDLRGKKLKKATLLIGLENVGGIVEYRDVRFVDEPVK